MRFVARLTSVAASATLMAALFPAISMSAVSAEEIEPSLSVESATIVDINGNEIPVSEDPGVPSGDDDNAVDTQAVAEDRGARIALELSHALGSKTSQDMRGYERSLYQGKWYMPKKEGRRRCIMDREANNRYRAVSAGGKYRGAYQMNRGLAIGATHMMMKEVRREMGDQGVQMVKQLRKIPTQQWNRYWQDRAFWTIWGKGKGAFHWRGGAWRC
jgi:hypothetical protein